MVSGEDCCDDPNENEASSLKMESMYSKLGPIRVIILDTWIESFPAIAGVIAELITPIFVFDIDPVCNAEPVEDSVGARQACAQRTIATSTPRVFRMTLFTTLRVDCRTSGPVLPLILPVVT
jgi:hypothetical protein